MGEEALDLKTRRSIYHFVYRYPGLHFRELCRKLHIPRSTLSYHLKYLEKRGLLITKSEGKYTCYYVSNNIGNDQKKVLPLLRREVPRNIILYLLTISCASQIELSKSLEKHPTTIEFHLKKLLDIGIIEPAPVDNKKVYIKYDGLKIVERAPIGKEIIYRLKDPYSIYDSVILYKKKSSDKNFCNIPITQFKFWSTFDKPKTKSKSFQRSIDAFEEMIYEIFPHPYHV